MRDLLFDLLLELGPDSRPGVDRETIQRLAAEAPDEVVDFARAGDTLEAIRLYRKLTGADLRRALAVVTWLGKA